VPDGNFGEPLWLLRSGRQLVDGMKHVSAVVAVAAGIADADRHVLEDDETIFVLEHFLLDGSWLTVPPQYSHEYSYIISY
jgi:hypothetical protein